MADEQASTKERSSEGARLARRFAWAFGAVAVVLIAFLIITGSDWRDAIKTTVEKGRRLRALHYGFWGVWWGCALDAVVCTLLALTSRWWGSTPASPAATPATAPPRMRRGAWLGLLAIIAVAGVTRWERLGLSFYNDEAQSFRRYIGGQHVLQKDGTVYWHEAPWWETVWLNKVANNSMPFTLLGRVSFDTWAYLSGRPTEQISERAVRLPIFLAATAGLAMLFFLVRRMLPDSNACWWVLALAALHPWHVRYSSEARGHGYLMLGIPMCFWFLHRALQDDRWRWWLGMGLAQFFCIWSFQGVIPFIAVCNGMLLVWMMWQARQGQSPWGRLARPVVAMIVGAMVTMPVMLPLVRQLLEALPTLDSLKGDMGLHWFQDVVSLALSGMVWVDGDPDNAQNLALSRIVAMHPWVWVLAPSVLATLAWGARRMTRNGLLGVLAVVAGPLASAAMWVFLSRKGTLLYPWYLIFMLPGLLMVWSAGIAALAETPRTRVARAVVLVALLLPLAGLAWVDEHIITVPKENLRGLARAVPADALHGSLYSDVDVYDDDVVVLKDTAGLDRLIADARAKAKPLYVSFSLRNFSTESQAFYQRVRDATAFEHIADFPGQNEPQFTHHLYRLRK
ncbi:MAG TPA: glycosyltransferase family 39 protein [Candidatus Saccharimonadia bacterium]|nr:glycosyltransferase family 39 protein [Candidatus Saccharimonadia bacterium]